MWNYVLFVSIIERDKDKIGILISIVFCSEEYYLVGQQKVTVLLFSKSVGQVCFTEHL